MTLDCRSAPVRGLRRYVRLVATALGRNADRSVVEWTHPVDAHLTLHDRLHWCPDRQVALGWNASEGWTMFLTARSRGCRTLLRFLGDDPLPAPGAVAAFSAGMFHDEFTGQTQPPPRRSAADDRDLVARLAGYALPHVVHRERRYPRRVHLRGVITSWPGRA
ncbi:DUF6292 family protein [Actinophytocola sp. KF-1]